MPGRILNFSEFFDKYSKDSGDSEKTIDSFTQAASNFEAGFDDETYDQTQLGPNKPVASGSDATPAMPGDAGTPQFSSTPNSEMSAPVDDQEEQEEQEELEDTEEIETDETPEPEAGANPEEEKEEAELITTGRSNVKGTASESFEFNKVKGFAQFIAESDWGADYLQDDDYWTGEEHSCVSCGAPVSEGNAVCPDCEDDSSDEDAHYSEDACPNCGSKYDEYGSSCGCNM